MFIVQPDQQLEPGFAKLSHRPEALLVPESIRKAILQEQEEKRRRDDAALESQAKELMSEDTAVKETSEPAFEYFRPVTYSVEVFGEAAIKSAMEGSKRRDRDTRERITQTMAVLQRQNGRRWLPDIEADVVEAIGTSLRRQFPSFGNVIDLVEAELTLCMAANPDTFRVSPLCLYGPAGVGKTAFAMALARLLDVGFGKVGAAGTQGAFEFVGTAIHWSNAGPGKVFELLATGDYACPVFLIDEVDKMPDDTRNPITPALLELLEPISAREFVDQSLNIKFDASKLIVITTANDISAIPEPLLSRMNLIEVRPPTVTERRQIAESIFHETVGGLITNISIQAIVLDQLAGASVDIRTLGRLLRDGIGRAIRAGKDIVGTGDVRIPNSVVKGRVGFV